MRFGWLAAAAAILFASQAEAARYYQFEIGGLANTELFQYPVPTAYQYYSTTTVTFDTMGGPGSGLYVTGGAIFAMEFGIDGSGNAYIATLPQPSGPLFSLRFKLSDILNSDTLHDVPADNNAFKYRIRPDGRYTTTYDTLPGSITRFAGRTTDVAPPAGISEALRVTVLPEPASWALMLLGAGAIGATMRRRSRALRYAK